jgi:hypothetical protein
MHALNFIDNKIKNNNSNNQKKIGNIYFYHLQTADIALEEKKF